MYTLSRAKSYVTRPENHIWERILELAVCNYFVAKFVIWKLLSARIALYLAIRVTILEIITNNNSLG